MYAGKVHSYENFTSDIVAYILINTYTSIFLKIALVSKTFLNNEKIINIYIILIFAVLSFQIFKMPMLRESEKQM